MNFLYTYRMVCLGLITILNIPVLGLLAHWTQGSNLNHVTYSFESLGLYTSCLSFLVFPTMLALPEIRKNAYALYIYSELSIICTMWIFWVATAALAIQGRETFYPLGNCQFLATNQVHWCTELFGIVGLTVVIFVLLMKYMLVLLIYSTIVSFRSGKQVWFRSVKELQIQMPSLTHNPGDLEAKIGKHVSSSSIAMNTYPPPNQPTQFTQPTTYSPPMQTSGFGAPTQAKMQVIPAAAARPTPHMAYSHQGVSAAYTPSASMPQV